MRSHTLATKVLFWAGLGVLTLGSEAEASGDWMGQVQADLATREYEVAWQAAPAVEGIEPSWHAPNRAHGFRTYFTPAGIQLVPRTEGQPEWRWGLTLLGSGRGGTAWRTPQAELHPSQNRIDYRRGALVEGRWFTVPGNGWQEADLRTPLNTNVSVTQSDAVDPVLIGAGDLTYNILVSNIEMALCNSTGRSDSGDRGFETGPALPHARHQIDEPRILAKVG